MSAYYNVVYQGKILEGFDFEAAKNKLIEKFALNREKAEKVLNSRRVVLKKAVDEMTARKLGLALKRAGLDVILTKSRTAAAGDRRVRRKNRTASEPSCRAPWRRTRPANRHRCVNSRSRPRTSHKRKRHPLRVSR